MTITGSGNVGIGTTSPDSKLEIIDSNNHLNLKVADTISQSVMKFSDSAGLGGAINYDHNSDKLHFITDGTATPANGALNIDSTGKVGIGTTIPNQKITIGFADAGVDGISFRSTSNANLAMILCQNESGQDGNLQFFTRSGGTASPRLLVKSNGTINISNVSTHADVAAAVSSGLVAGDVFKTATGALHIV